MAWAANRAYQLGVPSADRWSVSGRTSAPTQSRSSVESPTAANICARSFSIGSRCLPSMARSRSTRVPKW